MAKSVTLTLILFFSINSLALPQGNSAWVYGKKVEWIKEIQNFNQHVPAVNRINYLFPNTASVHVTQEAERLIINYDPSITQFYKRSLKNIKILPDLSFWVGKSNFKTWSKLKYKLAADDVAVIINKDPNADGVFLDLESYSPAMLPFYQELSQDFAGSNKILAVIVSPGEENPHWFQSLGKNAFVVLYGYDLYKSGDSALPVPPSEYRKRLDVAIDDVMKTAHATGVRVMIGVPAIATTREWERKITYASTITNPYRQIDYFREALNACQNVQRLPSYLGFSLWAFVKDFSNQQYFPLVITPKEWELLYQHESKYL